MKRVKNNKVKDIFMTKPIVNTYNNSTNSTLEDNALLFSEGDLVDFNRLHKYWYKKILAPQKLVTNGINPRHHSDFLDIKKVLELFNLRSFEFGNWVNQRERLQSMYAVADGLETIANYFSVPLNYMGLGGLLSIAIGSRGKGGFSAAEYLRFRFAIINVTKTNFATGTLAHEFAHAIDNLVTIALLTRYDDLGKYTNRGYMSGGFLTDTNIIYDRFNHDLKIVRDYEKLFELLYFDNGVANNFKTTLDTAYKHKVYWRRRTEVFARTFEAWFCYSIGHRPRNKMLLQESYNNNNAYPDRRTLNRISKHLYDLIQDSLTIINKQVTKNEELTKIVKEDTNKIKIDKPVVKEFSKSENNNITYGSDTRIVTPSEKLNGKYAIVELSKLVPSNDPFLFSLNPNYPQTCQTRSYNEDISEQTKVEQYTNNFDYRHILNTSPDATTGTPIITPDGIVLGGNGRSMILIRVAKLKKDKYKEYLDNIIKQSNIYGINADDIYKYKTPILVRIVEASMNECSKVSNILNKSNANEYDEIREGIAYARQIEETPNALNHIADIFSNSEAETFKQLINDKTVAKRLIDYFNRLGIINNSNTGSLLATPDTFSNRGESFVETLLLASILPDKKLISSAKSYTLKILKALPAFIRIKALPEDYNIIPEIQESIKLENRRRKSNLKLNEFLSQYGAFDEVIEPTVMSIYKIIEQSGLLKFKEFVNYYVDRAEDNFNNDSMFGEVLSKIEIINNYLKGNQYLSAKLAYSNILEHFSNMINDFANDLFEIPVVVSIDKNYLKVNHNRSVISRFDLEHNKIITNENDMFGNTNMLKEYNRLSAVLLSYINKLRKQLSRYKKQGIANGKELYTQDNKLFDKPLQYENIFSSGNLADIEGLLSIAKSISEYKSGYEFLEEFKNVIEKKNYDNVFINKNTFLIKYKGHNINVMDFIPKVYYSGKADTITLFDNSENNDINDNSILDNYSIKAHEGNSDDDVIINLNDILNVKTEPLKIKGKSKLLLNSLNSPFRMLIWGKQGGGKSTFMLQLLNDISENGKILLAINEEKIASGRITQRVKKAGIKNLANIDIDDSGNYNKLVELIDSGKYFCVAIDSKDNFDYDENLLLQLWANNPKLSFILISHSQKTGNTYTGNRKFAHLADTEVQVVKGIVTTIKHRDDISDKSIQVFNNINNKYKISDLFMR